MAALAAVAVVLANLLLDSGQRLRGTNPVRPVAFVASIGPGQRLCQAPEIVPKGAGSLLVKAGAGRQPGPALLVTAQADGRQLTYGVIPPGFPDGAVVLGRVKTTPRFSSGVTVCLRNLGRVPVALAGQPGPRAAAAVVGGRSQRGRIRLDWLSPDKRTWLQEASMIAGRIGHGKGDWWSGWTVWVALAAVAFAWVAGMMVLVRAIVRTGRAA